MRLTDELHGALSVWALRWYRDSLTARDLADPALLDETRGALDELAIHSWGLGSGFYRSEGLIQSPRGDMRRLSIICGAASLVILATATVVGGLVYTDYDHLTQFISELGANGAVTSRRSPGLHRFGRVARPVLAVGDDPVAQTLLAVIGFGLSALHGLGLMFGESSLRL